MPCFFLAGMLISSLSSPAADEFWHRYFWNRILPRPSPEFLKNNPWASLANDIMYDTPVQRDLVLQQGKLPFDMRLRLHKNGNCCNDGVLIHLFKGSSWEDVETTLNSNLPDDLKNDDKLKFYSNDYEITSNELLLASYMNNIKMKKDSFGIL